MEWGFKLLSKDEPRTLGRNINAIERKIDNLVRESIQNVRDQGIQSDQAVKVHFRLLDLEGKELDQFKKEIGWDLGLKDHLNAISNGRYVHEQGVFTKNLATMKNGVMRVLLISDSNTIGLSGPEFGIEGNFCKLCRNEMIPSEGTGNAKNGGAFGIGKSAYWNFSGIRTVVFSSVYRDSSGKSISRVFGRTYLPDHDSNGSYFSGDAFFCKRIIENGEELRHSMTFQEAEITDSSLLYRDIANTGTTIAIVLFDERSEDSDRSIEDVAKQIRDAIVVNFWPLIESNLIDATVEWSGVSDEGTLKVVIPDEFKVFLRAASVAQDVDVFAGNSESILLEEQGVAHFKADIVIPARTVTDSAHSQFTGCLSVGVTRLTEEEFLKLESFQARYQDVLFLNRFACVRNPRMVVEYRELVESNANRHVGVIRAGGYRQLDPTLVSTEDANIEQFLRDSEPPMHNNWFWVDKVVVNYKRGGLSSVRNSFEEIGTKARALLKPVLRGVAERPKGLADKLRIRKGDKDGGGVGPILRGFQIRSSMFNVKFDLKNKRVSCDVRVERVRLEKISTRRAPWKVLVGVRAVGEESDAKLHHVNAAIDVPNAVLNASGSAMNVTSYEIELPATTDSFVVSLDVSLSQFADAVIEKIRILQFADLVITGGNT